MHRRLLFPPAGGATFKHDQSVTAYSVPFLVGQTVPLCFWVQVLFYTNEKIQKEVVVLIEESCSGSVSDVVA